MSFFIFTGIFFLIICGVTAITENIIEMIREEEEEWEYAAEE